MQKEFQFSIDACADILHNNNDNLYKKCKSVYVLADDLIEEKYDWLMDFLSPNLCAALKKMKTSVRRGALLRGIKMAIEAACNGAKMQEVVAEDIPDFMARSARAFEVSWISCPEKKLTFFVESRDVPQDVHISLSEYDCFKNGVALCLDSRMIKPEKLAAEYDIFYHTRYPERAKEFDVFVDKVSELNHLNPALVVRHDDKLYPINSSEHTME